MAEYELTEANKIWNRATMERGGAALQEGDVALSSLLRAHGLIMNGGVFHAVELLSDSELGAAANGYRYFGLDGVVKLLARAKNLLASAEDLEYHEPRLDVEYGSLIPDDEWLAKRFEEHLRANPSAFASL